MTTAQTRTDSEAVTEKSTATDTPSTPRPLPDGLASDRAKLVLLYLETTAAAGVEELAHALGLTRLALFPVLDSLIDAGVVEQRDDAYVSVR